MKRTRLPNDYRVTAHMVDLARKNGWPDPNSEIDAFRDYHLAHGKVMLDWDAAFRTWLRNAAKWGSKAPQNHFRKSTEMVKRHAEPPLTTEQRRENIRKLHEFLKGIGKPIK